MALLDFLGRNGAQPDQSTYVAPQYQQQGLLGGFLAGLQRPMGQAQQQVGGLLGPIQSALWGQGGGQPPQQPPQPSATGYQGYQPMGGTHRSGGIGNLLKFLMG